MSCTIRCRTAGPGGCCCECQGQHHGEAAPIQQKRLALDGLKIDTESPLDPEAMARATLKVEIHPADCPEPCCTGADHDECPEPCCADVLAVLAEQSRELWADVARREDVAIMASGRLPHDRTIEGRTVHLSPGYRYTLDSEGEPIWFAYFGATHTSAVDPDVAARKALGLHGPPA